MYHLFLIRYIETNNKLEYLFENIKINNRSMHLSVLLKFFKFMKKNFTFFINLNTCMLNTIYTL